MAESYSVTPDNEATPVVEAAPIPEKKNRARILIDNLFRAREDKEKKDDDEDNDTETSPSKQGRTRNLFRKFFPSIVGREEVHDSDKNRYRGSLFFGIEDHPEPSNRSEEFSGTASREVSQEFSEGVKPDVAETVIPLHDTAKVSAAETASPLEEAAGGAGHTPEASVTTPEPKSEEYKAEEVTGALDESGSSELPPPSEALEDVIDRTGATAAPTIERYEPSEPAPTQENYYVQGRNTTPELVLLGGIAAYEHRRVSKLKKREAKVEQHVKKLQKEVRQGAKEQSTLRAEVAKAVAEKQPVTVFERAAPRQQKEAQPSRYAERAPETHRMPVARVEAMRSQRTAEMSPADTRTIERPAGRATEKMVDVSKIERVQEQYDAQEKQAIIEKILTKPENLKETVADEHKDIAYELSHEHKDLDRQGAAAWAAIQATADATAKANAHSLARAARATQAATARAAAAHAASPDESPSDHAKTVVGGLVSVVVLIAIIIAIILL